MRAPLSWLAEHAELGADTDARTVAAALIRAGLEVETVDEVGADVTGPVVIGRVLEFADEPQKNGKTIRWCRVDVGTLNPDGEDGRGIVCGAHNFAVGDLVVVSLPGAVLAGGFAISARKTYGHVSDGMICSAAELGLPDDGVDGIMIIDGAGDQPAEPGADALPILALREDVLDIAVTPDRGYCFSIRGLAREAAAAADVAFHDPVDRSVPAPSDAGHPVRLETPGCPLFVAVGVTGIDPTRRSPSWLTRRLVHAGMRPISLTVDITNYVMLQTGQPLHAYDAARLDGAITVRTARPGERLTTLDDQDRALDEADLVIADGSGPIGLAGVMGGATTEISDATTAVVIEAAQFAAGTIAATSRRHKLSSEASRRFERGVDPAATYAAAHRVADLLAELAGGTVTVAETVAGAVPATATTALDADLPGRILGTDVASERVVELIERIGATVTRADDRLEVTAPTWRPDLTDPYDYVEEVGRQIGLDTIEPVLPTPPSGRGRTAAQRARRDVRTRLAHLGLVEVLTFPFCSTGDLDALAIPAEDGRRRLVRLANPLAETKPYLRTTLLPGLIGAAARNLSRGAEDLALFEIGSVFRTRSERPAAPRPAVTGRPSAAELAALDAALPVQPHRVAGLLVGSWRRAGWAGPAEPVGWQHAVAAAEAVAAAVGSTLHRSADDHAPWHPGRCARLEVTGPDGGAVLVGHAGELHPQVCREVGLPVGSCAFELGLDLVVDRAPGPGSVAPLSSFPVAKEDVALVVDAGVTAQAVADALRDGAGPLLESVRLFDVWTDDRLGVGRRSLAFALRFRGDRTLTDADTAAAREAAVAEAARRTGAELRS